MKNFAGLFGKLAVLLGFPIIMSACTTVSTDSVSKVQSGETVVYSDPADLIGVQFKSAMPGPADSFLESLIEVAEKRKLESDLKIAMRMPSQIPMRVVAFTDNQECSTAQCVELSIRRAKGLHDWLIERGLPATRLLEPRGYGSARPIGDNMDVVGRSLNRRAYISYSDEG